MTKQKKEQPMFCRYCEALFKDEEDNFLCGSRSHLVYGIDGLQITDRLKETCSLFVDAKKPANINSITMMKRLNKKKDEEEDDSIYTSCYINKEKNLIAEEIYDTKTNKARFCVHTKNSETKIEYLDELNIDGVKYKPIVGEEILKGAILLPSKAEEYGTDDELDQAITEYINKWLDVPKNILQFALWNIKRSWVYERFHTLNYLRALGDTGQGKSRFLDTLGSIHYKPINTSGATTSAPVFRVIDKWRGTLIMDEADFSKSDESQDIIKIINMGYERGKFVMRCDQNDAKMINFFDPYCPKILATRKTYTDKATESRCITQVMTGTERKDIPPNLNEHFFIETQILRNKLLMWRFNNYFEIEPTKEYNLDMGNLEPRVKQIVTSFISLFINDEKQLKGFSDYIQSYQEDLIEERKNSFDGEIVTAIHDLVENGSIHINAMDIIEYGGLTRYDGKPLQPRGLSSHLRSLGFGKPKSVKINGKAKRCLILRKEHLNGLFRRYGVTVVTVTMETSDFLKEELEKKGDANRKYRNNRNSVTDYDEAPIVKSEEIIESFTKIPKEESDFGKCEYCSKMALITHIEASGKKSCSYCAGSPISKKVSGGA